jgi:ribosomal protein S18 acetylase RimI-like enzyme
MNITFRTAECSDAAAIADLSNSAYRGDTSRLGWTTEADLLEGARTDEEEVRGLIQEDDSMFLLCFAESELVGSVYLQQKADAAYIGLFVVDPQRQGAGIGKLFLEAAEAEVKSKWSVSKVTMWVISVREELISYYERRGYSRTGETQPFPEKAGDSVPRVQGLEFAILEKNLEC